jgi:hypothetical protein
MKHEKPPALDSPAELVALANSDLLPLPFSLVHLPRPLHTSLRVTGGVYFEVQVRLKPRGVVYGAFVLTPGDTAADFSRKLLDAYQACSRELERRG